MSWVDPTGRRQVSAFLFQTTEPILGPVRRHAAAVRDDRLVGLHRPHPSRVHHRAPLRVVSADRRPLRRPPHAEGGGRPRRWRHRWGAACTGRRSGRRRGREQRADQADRRGARRGAQRCPYRRRRGEPPEAGGGRRCRPGRDRCPVAGPAGMITARAIGSVVRARGSHPRGHWFESSIAHHPPQSMGSEAARCRRAMSTNGMARTWIAPATT